MGGLRAVPGISFGPAAGALLLAVSTLVPADVWAYLPTTVGCGRVAGSGFSLFW